MARARGYGQFCPVAVASELLAERWTPLVVRELLMGSVRFNDLQRGLPRMSPALLAARLRTLEFSGVIERRPGAAGASEYHLTDAGRELIGVIETMGVWAQRWLRHRLVEDDKLDPSLLMWDIRRTVQTYVGEPPNRQVTEFQVVVAPRCRRFWLLREPGGTDLCQKDPGFDVDLVVGATVRVLTEIWLGHLSIETAENRGALRLDGARAQVEAFRRWFSLSTLAPAARRAAGA